MISSELSLREMVSILQVQGTECTLRSLAILLTTTLLPLLFFQAVAPAPGRVASTGRGSAPLLVRHGRKIQPRIIATGLEATLENGRKVVTQAPAEVTPIRIGRRNRGGGGGLGVVA